ncbi:hypothetical protein Tco_0890556 [Tanacetum coccineum]|uniref:Uncharacterized protein n=1 Tax=Tanacetum coccineum TaxID=301880 RepID=A0ABQ5C6C8_9ASTR
MCKLRMVETAFESILYHRIEEESPMWDTSRVHTVTVSGYSAIVLWIGSGIESIVEYVGRGTLGDMLEISASVTLGRRISHSLVISDAVLEEMLKALLRSRDWNWMSSR